MVLIKINLFDDHMGGVNKIITNDERNIYFTIIDYTSLNLYEILVNWF